MTQTESEVRNNWVLPKFNDPNGYISKRLKPEATTPPSPKFYDEELTFWTTQIMKSHWTKELFNSEFDKVYKINHSANLNSSPAHNNYIGQTFKIDKDTFESGMFLAGISVFTSTEDVSATMTLDVRKMVNGIPADVIPGSIKTIRPDTSRTKGQVVGWDSTQSIFFKDSERVFYFEDPIYLEPGYYCFTLTTNSSNYSVFLSQTGSSMLGGGATVVNPYIGDYIYSSQGESWVIDPTKDLCFSLLQSVYEVGTKTISIKVDNPNKSDFDFDMLYLALRSNQFGKKSYISGITSTVTQAGTTNQSTLDIEANRTIPVPSRSTVNETDSVTFNVSLTNTDVNLTPKVDMNLAGVVLTKYLVNKYSTEVSNSELTANKGLALAKYFTKPVTLNEGFDADGITVYVDVQKPLGTKIEVFYRIQNKYDTNIRFSDSQWYLLPQLSGATASNLSDDFVEETYQQLGIEYVGTNGTLYSSFNTLAIKVVFYADDPTKVPSIRNLRVIATV